LLLNSRCPDLLEGDLGAMMGSLKIGAARLSELLQEIGEGKGTRMISALLDYGERRMRAEIDTLPDGDYFGEDGSDTDCFQSIEVPVKVKVTVLGSNLVFDFTGSAPQIRGFKNSSLANTHSAVYVAVAAFLGPTLSRNSGAFRSVSIVAPLGTVINAPAPAPMTMNTIFPATDIVMACWKALATAGPARACAGWASHLTAPAGSCLA
jgi:N-methylhydantoinase B